MLLSFISPHVDKYSWFERCRRTPFALSHVSVKDSRPFPVRPLRARGFRTFCRTEPLCRMTDIVRCNGRCTSAIDCRFSLIFTNLSRDSITAFGTEDLKKHAKRVLHTRGYCQVKYEQ